MSILDRFGFQGSREPLSRFQAFALEQLISFHCGSGDMRWSLVALAADAVAAIWASGTPDWSDWCESSRRPGKGLFRGEIADADTMVAAGRWLGSGIIPGDRSPHDYPLRLWHRLRPAGNQPFRDQDRSPVEDGGAGLSQGKGHAAGVSQGAIALHRRRGREHRRFHLHSRPYRSANTVSISTHRSICSSARRPGRSSG